MQAPAELSPRTRTLVYAALTVQTLISAGTYLAAKRAMVELPPFTLVLLRFFISAGVFAAVLVALPGPKLPPRPLWGRILWLGFLAGPVNQGLFFHGLSKSTAAHAALLYALTPVGVFVLASLRRQERADGRRLTGIAVAFAGVVVLLLGRGLSSAAGPLAGDLFILAAVAAWVLYTTDGRTLIAEAGAVRASAWSMTAGTLLITPLAPLVFDGEAVASASALVWACTLYLAVLTSVVAYILWYYALSKAPASRVAVFSNLQPVATAVAAWALLGEPLTWEIAVGGVLVIVGVRLAQR